VVKALEKDRFQPMYAKVREHGAPVQGARLGGSRKSGGRNDRKHPTLAQSAAPDDNSVVAKKFVVLTGAKRCGDYNVFFTELC
jgi:hypothetical protein